MSEEDRFSTKYNSIKNEEWKNMSIESKVTAIFYIEPKEVELQAVSFPKIRAFIQKLEGDEAMIRVRLPEFGIINTTCIQTGNELENLDNLRLVRGSFKVRGPLQATNSVEWHRKDKATLGLP
eukprot:scaffold98436_cov61-Attheya_sp.AAC.2